MAHLTASALKILLELLGEGMKYLSNAMPLLHMPSPYLQQPFAEKRATGGKLFLHSYLQMLNCELRLLPLPFACCDWDLQLTSWRPAK